MGRGRKDGAFVVLEDLEPVAEIRGVVVADVGRDAEVGAEEGRAKFGDQFLARIAFVAEALPAEVAGETFFVMRPVCELVERG